VRGTLDWPPVVLALAVMFWVAGFDVIYATMDDEFDRKAGIHSLVQKWGIRKALMASRLFHAVFVALLVGVGMLAALPALFYWGVAAIALFLAYEHSLVDANDLRRVNAAFFSVNGVISVFFLVLVAACVWVPKLAGNLN
jgi:4-hydroxybenzoate polyprenyltransferase